MRISKAFWFAFVVGLLALGVRVIGLGSFMTVDEENWMLRSAGFYHNLFLNHDPGGAFMTTHPGATTMWIAGAGIMVQEQRLGFPLDSSSMIHFRRAALWPLVFSISILIGIAVWLLQRLFGGRVGGVAGVLMALEPYAVGMSQVVHLDALLALFMLNAVLCFLQYRRAATFSGLVASGIFLGLGAATKLLPTVWLVIFFGLVLLWDYRKQPREIVRRLGFTLGIGALVFYVLWPALWFYTDLEKYFRREVPYVVQESHVVLEESEEPTSPAGFYVRTLLGRSTPFVQILTIGALVAMIRVGLVQRRVPELAWLLIYAIGFLLMISLAAKKADRYALPAVVALLVAAGWALSLAAQTQNSKLKTQNWILPIGALLMVVLLLAQVFVWVPHTIAYNNPLFNVRPLSQQGWGEGLEEAAAWLNKQPGAEELYVASWYPGVMRTFFKGKTLSLSSRHDERIGFVVLYRNMLGRGGEDIATNVLGEFRGEEPAYVVTIQGTLYVWVYDTRRLHYFPNHVGELYGQARVGQLVSVERDGWSAIEIGMVTFSSRGNTQDVILHVRESLEAVEDLRTVRVNAREIQDSSYHRFEFEPIADAAGKTFYVFLESPTSRPGDAVTVRFANLDLVTGEMVKNGAVLPGRDVAWRISK